MRYCLFFCFALILSCRVSAQTTITVDTGVITIVDTMHCFNHVLHAEVAGGLIPTSSGITADDNWSGVIPIGFTYNFYGLPNTQCIIGSNGCLGFNLANALAFNTWSISSALATGPGDIQNVICGPWCDVYIPSGGTIEYSTQGVAPFRNFAVTWCATRMFSCTSEWLTTQIIIYETTGIAEVHIGHRTVCLTGWNGQHAIIGVRNPTGAISTAAPGRDFPAVWPATNESWRFSPSGTTYTVSSIPYSPIPYAASAVYWYDSTTGAYLGSGDITVAPLTNTTYMACAIGCSDTTKAFITIGPATCFHAENNSPCLGDTLRLGGVGDSTGATYSWTGPAGFTSALQYPFLFPATAAMGGWYYVTKLIGGVAAHYDSTFVVIHPLPVITATSSIALCDPISDPMTLSVNLDSVGETFSWSGPLGFTSTLQNPLVTPFDSTMQGHYTVTGTTIWGCSATGGVDVWPGTSPDFVPVIKRGCLNDTVLFFNTTRNASSFVWDFGDGSATTSGLDEIHFYTVQNVFTVKLTSSNAHCTESKSIDIDTRHSVTALFNATPDTFCLGLPTTFVNNSNTTLGSGSALSPGGIILPCAWDFGNGVTDTVWQPTYTYDAPGNFTASLTVTDSIGCTSTITEHVYVMQLSISSFTDTTLCISLPMPMTNTWSENPMMGIAPQFIWTQSSPNLSDTSVQIPYLTGLGTFVDTLTVLLPGVPPDGCPIRDILTVHSVAGRPITDMTASATIILGNSIHLNADNEVIYYWRPDDGSLDNPNINDPIATPSVTTTYTVYGLDIYGCLDSASVVIYIDSTTPGGLPSAFTPNGDHVNDIFRPWGNKYSQLVEFRVYNRWGEEVYYTNTYGEGWDGKFHGVPQDIGNYFYSIVVSNPSGQNTIYKGSFVLIR